MGRAQQGLTMRTLSVKPAVFEVQQFLTDSEATWCVSPPLRPPPPAIGTHASTPGMWTAHHFSGGQG